MKKVFSVLVIVLAFGADAFSQVKYENYSNDRFFFSIDYPSTLLKMQPPPENEDGRTFISSDGTVEMRVWGQYNVLSETVRQRYLATLKSFNTQPSYMILGTYGFVVSGVKEEKIVYIKMLRHKDKGADVFYTLTIEYPTSRRKEFDAIVAHLANSFKIASGEDI